MRKKSRRPGSQRAVHRSASWGEGGGRFVSFMSSLVMGGRACTPGVYIANAHTAYSHGRIKAPQDGAYGKLGGIDRNHRHAVLLWFLSRDLFTYLVRPVGVAVSASPSDTKGTTSTSRSLYITQPSWLAYADGTRVSLALIILGQVQHFWLLAMAHSAKNCLATVP